MRKLLTLIIFVITIICVIGCDKPNSSNQDSNNDNNADIGTGENNNNNENNNEQPPVEEPEEYAYTAYNEDGSVVATNNSVWHCIAAARDVAGRKNITYVLKNDDGTKVFEYDTAVGACYAFKGDEYIKKFSSHKDAIAWGTTYPDSYVVGGTGKDYVYVGRTVESRDTSLNKNDEYIGAELFSGSYAYLHSKRNGYTYAEFTVKFSEARIKYATDTINEPNGWNAYVFCNLTLYNPWISCDMGIMNISTAEKGGWYPFFTFHYTHLNGGIADKPMYNPNIKDGYVTQMKFNEDTGFYEGADDLLFKCWYWAAADDSYRCFVMNITNLTTGDVREYECEIPQDAQKPNPSTAKLLLAASNCPAIDGRSYWNPRCGNAFENVKFTGMKVARYGNHGSKKDYGYDSDDFHYILTMGADNAKVYHGVEEGLNYFTISMKNDYK